VVKNEFEEVEESDQEISDDRKQKKKQPRINYRRIANQKKQRNALTNLGSQLLTYIYLKKKNVGVLKEKFAQLTS
jgi:hypothetical protein